MRTFFYGLALVWAWVLWDRSQDPEYILRQAYNGTPRTAVENIVFARLQQGLAGELVPDPEFLQATSDLELQGDWQLNRLPLDIWDTTDSVLNYSDEQGVAYGLFDNQRSPEAQLVLSYPLERDLPSQSESFWDMVRATGYILNRLTQGEVPQPFFVVVVYEDLDEWESSVSRRNQVFALCLVGLVVAEELRRLAWKKIQAARESAQPTRETPTPSVRPGPSRETPAQTRLVSAAPQRVQSPPPTPTRPPTPAMAPGDLAARNGAELERLRTLVAGLPEDDLRLPELLSMLGEAATETRLNKLSKQLGRILAVLNRESILPPPNGRQPNGQARETETATSSPASTSLPNGNQLHLWLELPSELPPDINPEVVQALIVYGFLRPGMSSSFWGERYTPRENVLRNARNKLGCELVEVAQVLDWLVSEEVVLVPHRRSRAQVLHSLNPDETIRSEVGRALIQSAKRTAHRFLTT